MNIIRLIINRISVFSIRAENDTGIFQIVYLWYNKFEGNYSGKKVTLWGIHPNKNLNHIVISDTVKEIGFHSFEDCTDLEEADIPGSVALSRMAQTPKKLALLINENGASGQKALGQSGISAHIQLVKFRFVEIGTNRDLWR